MTAFRVAGEGFSGDGSLRYEERAIEDYDGRDHRITSWVVISDAGSGAVLADAAGWTTSAVAPKPDGSLLLHLSRDGVDTLLRIDPAARSFRDLGLDGEEMPLVALAATMATLRPDAGDLIRQPARRAISPDGAIRVDSLWTEGADGRRVLAPRVIDLARGRTVLDLSDTAWDAIVTFPAAGLVRLRFTRPGEHGTVHVDVDPARDCCRIVADAFAHAGSGGAEAPLTGILPALEAAHARSAVRERRDAYLRRARDSSLARGLRRVLAVLLPALLILAAAIALARHVGAPEDLARRLWTGG